MADYQSHFNRIPIKHGIITLLIGMDEASLVVLLVFMGSLGGVLRLCNVQRGFAKIYVIKRARDDCETTLLPNNLWSLRDPSVIIYLIERSADAGAENTSTVAITGVLTCFRVLGGLASNAISVELRALFYASRKLHFPT